MMKEINNMNIHIVPPEFCIQEINPFTNQVYDKNWVYIEVNDENEYQCIEQTYKGHSYMDCYLREYENSVLVHSTPKDNYENIKRTGVLKSWNLLKKITK